jgi:hypothetical protein
LTQATPRLLRLDRLFPPARSGCRCAAPMTGFNAEIAAEGAWAFGLHRVIPDGPRRQAKHLDTVEMRAQLCFDRSRAKGVVTGHVGRTP